MNEVRRPAEETRRSRSRSRFIPLAVALLALALYHPSLRAGFVEDDWVGMATLAGHEISNARLLDLYLLSSGQPEDVSRLIPEASPHMTAKISRKTRGFATMRLNATMSCSSQSSRMVGIA